MKSLASVDQRVSDILIDLRQLINSATFANEIEFTLTNNIDCTIFDKYCYAGIYLIEIKVDAKNTLEDWLKAFQIKWEDEKFKWSFVPNLKRKRIRMITLTNGWLPLYIGKSRNISKRIKEHLNLKLTQPTTALKLLARENLHNEMFRVSTVEISVVNYDLIVPQFENEFRDKINPIVGRK